jgi:Holliday junction resolvase RusA-like endonuclease
MSESLTFTVPLTPPSVNHYKVPVWNMRRFYVTAEATAFMNAVAVCAQGRKVEAKEYAVTMRIFLGKGQKGDLANFEKVVGDGLVKAKVIHTDDAIMEYHQYKSRDRQNPRTEITVSAL